MIFFFFPFFAGVLARVKFVISPICSWENIYRFVALIFRVFIDNVFPQRRWVINLLLPDAYNFSYLLLSFFSSFSSYSARAMQSKVLKAAPGKQRSTSDDVILCAPIGFLRGCANATGFTAQTGMSCRIRERLLRRHTSAATRSFEK